MISSPGSANDHGYSQNRGTYFFSHFVASFIITDQTMGNVTPSSSKATGENVRSHLPPAKHQLPRFSSGHHHLILLSKGHPHRSGPGPARGAWAAAAAAVADCATRRRRRQPRRKSSTPTTLYEQRLIFEWLLFLIGVARWGG